ncbi:MAG: LD-carboxypeptidase family protein [Clostridia bacterium]|jgi:muramoyltetrapeptide carboxypeptidase LdcA involved in peptidoglycan recycling|nr:LD-carboxypeptidase family protein [Clostridia bacterium]
MPLLNKGDKVALVGCSNAQPFSNRTRNEEVLEVLRGLSLEPILSEYIYDKNSVFSGEAKDKAKAFMNFYQDSTIKAIFDISGGDLANEVLEYLDYDIIKKLEKPVFGYSDLTTILNALYSQTGIKSYLYQIRNLIGGKSEEQQFNFMRSLFEDKSDLYQFSYRFLQGDRLEGTVIGGNIRCLLKLAGTKYMPNFKDKVLFLESYGGRVAQMSAYLNQYRQIGVFEKVKGIILGTYTTMEEECLQPTIEELVIKIVNNASMPIVKTDQIGHSGDSKCIIIGNDIRLL